MQRGFRIIVAAVVALAIVAFMTTYTVRFTEAAVVSTFGRADASSVKTDPGLGFKWPYPIQSVIKYDTRKRYTQTRSETLSTADNRPVILQTFVVWKVENPLEFYRSYGNAGPREVDHVRQAEETLRAKLRSALSQTSGYKLADLLHAGPAGTKLAELEKGLLTALKDTAKDTAGGVTPISVGIESMELPQSVTGSVFTSMKAAQTKIADGETKRGETEASTIRARADGDAKKILAFADRLAEQIKSQGQLESVKFLAMQKEDPQLAVFLQNLRFLREATSKRTTLVLPLSMSGFQLLDTKVQQGLGKGQVPSISVGDSAAGGTK